MYYDINCFCGHWPFAYLRHAGFAELIKTHTGAGISGGALASFDSVFYNDPAEGDAPFLPLARGAGYQPVMSVNPRLPMVTRDIERLAPAAVRVYPTLHGYRLMDDCMTELTAFLTERNLPLLVSARLTAAREAYLLTPPEPDADDTAAFIAAHPRLKIALLSYDKTELYRPALKDAILSADNACFDISWIRYTAIEPLAADFGVDRMLYGSLHPLLCLESTRLTLEKSALSDTDKAKVAGGNYCRLFGI